MKNVSIGIGIFLGMLAVPIAMYYINRVVYKGNNAEKAAPIYIRNSEDLKVVIPEAAAYGKSGPFDFKFKSYKKNIQADRDGYVCEIWFFSKEYGKYFNFLLYDNLKNDDLLLCLNISGQKTRITVNKNDL
ncbi:hypothetical protein ABIB40_004032 [Pedobacter sp. UYP30]|uniref:hypothetical protein n=1 Tax=Pedobacter sp. UYP30 TaxID=1756400 RepID=UPI0033960878